MLCASEDVKAQPCRDPALHLKISNWLCNFILWVEQLKRLTRALHWEISDQLKIWPMISSPNTLSLPCKRQDSVQFETLLTSSTSTSAITAHSPRRRSWELLQLATALSQTLPFRGSPSNKFRTSWEYRGLPSSACFSTLKAVGIELTFSLPKNLATTTAYQIQSSTHCSHKI